MGNVEHAIDEAEHVLRSVLEPAADGTKDPRWHAVISVAEFSEDHPLVVWDFVSRWGCSGDQDLRSAIATCALEHLLEHHFELIFPKAEALASENQQFADTVGRCWTFELGDVSPNALRLRELQETLRHVV